MDKKSLSHTAWKCQYHIVFIPQLQNKWNKAFWARGYYVSIIGNVTEEAIKSYIQEQNEESRQEEAALERL